MSTSPSSTAGRIIRAALIVLPFGTIVLGALSFVIYFKKEEKKVARSARYAMALRHELDLAGLQKHEQILRGAAAQNLRNVSAYVESTLGPENMGYNLRIVQDKVTNETLAIEAELTGTQKPNDVVLVLAAFAPAASVTEDLLMPSSLSVMLGVAHANTGQSRQRTVRFVAVRDAAALDAWYAQAVSLNDRVTHVILLGALRSMTDASVIEAVHMRDRGTLVLRPGARGDLLEKARETERVVFDLAERA